MMRLAVAALAWRAAAAYDYGDRVRVRAKSRGGGVETEWIDVVSPSAPNFREASAPLLRGVPLPPGAGGAASELRLAFAPGVAVSWLPFRDGAGRRLSRVDVALTHDGDSVVAAAATGAYGGDDFAKRGGEPEPSRFAPAVRVAYAWTWRAAADDYLARTLALLFAAALCACLACVTVRDSDYDEAQDYETARDAPVEASSSGDESSDGASSDGGSAPAHPTLHRRQAPKHAAYDSDDDRPPVRARVH